MSAYAFSLIMDRELIININKPCQLEEHFEPNEINWSIKQIENYSRLSKYKMFIDYNGDFVRNNLKKVNFLNYKSNKDIILFRTGFNLVKYLTLNSNHHEKIKSLGYSLDTFNLEFLFHSWYRRLFKFNKKLLTKSTGYQHQICSSAFFFYFSPLNLILHSVIDVVNYFYLHQGIF